jgi:diguanylate cyclase (GGDEF)-like protein
VSLSLKVKTNIAFLGALLTLATMSWFSFRESRRLADMDRRVSHTRDVFELTESLRSHMADAGAARRAYLLTGEQKQSDVFSSAGNSALADLAALRKLAADNPSQTVPLAAVEPLLRSRLSILKSSMDLHQKTTDDRNAQDALTDQGAKLSAQFLDLIHGFEAVQRDLLQQSTTEAEVSSQRARKVYTSLGVSIFLFLIVALAVLNRELSRRSQAELAVGEERKLLESILNSCSDVVIVADKSGMIILRNPAAVRLYGTISVPAVSDKYPQLLGLYRADGFTHFAMQDLPLVRTVRGESVDGVEMYIRPPDQAEGRYFLAAGRPLTNDNGECRGGVIYLRDITDRKKSDEQLGAALQESEMNARERSELNNLADLFQSCDTVEEACKIIEALSSPIFDSRPGALCLTNSSRNLVESAAVWNNCSTTKEIFDPSDCWALRLGKPYAGGNPSSPLRCSHVDASVTKYLCVPLVAQGETYGVLYVEDRTQPSAISIEESTKQQKNLHRRATAVAERISLAVANLKLREVLRNQSIRDGLTGLFNRRYLEESLNREIHRAARTHRSVSLVMLDLDHFKQFNDTFGHQAGDLLLREVAAVIKSRVRAADLACRYGGEEFALILSDVDTEGARSCVNNLREAIKQLSLQYRGQSLGSITISAGIAAFPTHSEDSENLIHAADEALYRAKKQGRNRVVVSEEQKTVPS